MPSLIYPLQQANKHGVSKRQWRKWPDLAQRVFNETYSVLMANQSLMPHPKSGAVPKEQWKTTAWNAAWMAADAVVNGLEGIVAMRGYARKR